MCVCAASMSYHTGFWIYYILVFVNHKIEKTDDGKSLVFKARVVWAFVMIINILRSLFFPFIYNSAVWIPLPPAVATPNTCKNDDYEAGERGCIKYYTALFIPNTKTISIVSFFLWKVKKVPCTKIKWHSNLIFQFCSLF